MTVFEIKSRPSDKPVNDKRRLMKLYYITDGFGMSFLVTCLISIEPLNH